MTPITATAQQERAIQAVLRDRGSLLALLPRVIACAEGATPTHIQYLLTCHTQAIIDAKMYLAGYSQSDIRRATAPHQTRQTIDQRIKRLVRHTLQEHPE